MAFSIYDTHTLYGAVQLQSPQSSFLKDRYFPTAGVFSTTDVLVDIRDYRNQLAPFVVKRKHGITVDRIGYETRRYTPPYIAPQMTLTADNLEKRGFGEALWSTDTPEQRAARYIKEDIDELDKMIARREEMMCADVMFNNKLEMRHYADKIGSDSEYEDMVLQYYDGDTNPATYTPTTKWDQSGAKIIADITAMVRTQRKMMNPASELLISSDVASVVLDDPEIRSVLDNRRFELGHINPAYANGVETLGVLNCGGSLISVFCYDGWYVDDDGATQSFVPAGKVCLTAPATGATAYGAITQMEEDEQFHTRAGARVPKVLADKVENTRTLTLMSAPIMYPKTRNPFLVADVLS